MTVKKLIQELQKCPEDLEVFTTPYRGKWIAEIQDCPKESE